MVRKFLVVMSAALLGLSLLVSTGSPVGAANTASESLFDNDNNAATPSVRRFAGLNRYSTAVSLAEAYVAAPDAGGNIDDVILVSGDSVADAAAAAALAADKTAPVLLTDPDRLTRSVRDFIDDEFVTTVYVLGGGISESVIAELNAIGTVKSVVTLSGADRYATSVEVANVLGEPGEYCGTGTPTAILVNVDNSFADVIAAGPLAYALSLPILLTPSDILPSTVAGYLLDEDVEQVIILGGTTSVSQGIQDELEDFGVTDVVRLAGRDRFATAIEVYDLLADCATVTVSSTTVALVNADSTADGVVAAPLLGAGLGGDRSITPVLLVSSAELPTATRNFLTSSPLRTPATTYANLSITAIGGTSTVTEAVMEAAIAAAITSADLTATITAEAGDNKITIKFSDAVNNETDATKAAFATSVYNKDHYSVSGSLFNQDMVEYSNTTNTATITLQGHSLAEGNVITVAGDAITGAESTIDLRRVMPASLTVTPTPPDNTRPRLEVVAAAGAHEFAVKTTEENPRDGELITKGDITLNGAPLSDHSRIYYQPAQQLAIVCLDGLVTNRVSVTASFADDDDVTASFANADGQFVDSCATADQLVVNNDTPTDNDIAATTLAARDRIDIINEAVVDNSGNRSRSIRHNVDDSAAHPEIRSASVTRPVTVLDDDEMPVLASASWTLVDPDANDGYPLAELKIYDDIAANDDDDLPTTDIPFYVYLKADSPHLTYVRDQRYGRCPYQFLPADNSALNYELGTTVAVDQTATGMNTISTYEFHDCQSATLPTFNLFFDLQTDAAVSDIVTLVGADTTNPFILSGADGAVDNFAALYEDDTDATVDGGAQRSFTILSQAAVETGTGITPPTEVTITAREDGIASGATGSDWAVEWARLATDEDEEAEITVNVLENAQTVLISFDDDASIDDVRSVALATEDFSDNFTFDANSDNLLTYDTAVMSQFTDPSGPLSRQRTELAGGESQVTLTLRYDEVLSTFDPAAFRLANSGLNGLFKQGTLTYTPQTYYREYNPASGYVVADATPTSLDGAEELVAIDSFAESVLCNYNTALVTAATQSADEAYGDRIGSESGTKDCRNEPHDVILTDTIVFTIVYTSADDIVQRNDILVLPTGIARSYRDSSTGSTVVDGFTTPYGSSLFANRELRSG